VQTLLQWENKRCYIRNVCVCSLRYPACNAPVPYCYLWPSPLYNIFPLFLINVMIFEKKNVTEHKMYVSSFSAILSETFLILRRIERDMIKNVHRSPYKVQFILVRF